MIPCPPQSSIRNLRERVVLGKNPSQERTAKKFHFASTVTGRYTPLRVSLPKSSTSQGRTSHFYAENTYIYDIVNVTGVSCYWADLLGLTPRVQLVSCVHLVRRAGGEVGRWSSWVVATLQANV